MERYFSDDQLNIPIMMLDDDPIVLFEAEITFKKLSFSNVSLVPDTNSAIQCIKGQYSKVISSDKRAKIDDSLVIKPKPIKVFFVDILLPGDVSGLDLIRAIRTEESFRSIRDLIIVAFSANLDSVLIKKLWDLQVKYFVSKPADISRFVDLFFSIFAELDGRRGL